MGTDWCQYRRGADGSRGQRRQHNGISAGDLETSGAKAFVLNFGDGETTSINEVLSVVNEESAAAWYDLQGRRLSGQPTAKGLYIHNGKKIVVK